MLPNDRINPLFIATIQATEEAVVNAILAAETMTSADGIPAFGLPADRVVALLEQLVAQHGAPQALRCDNGPDWLAVRRI